MGANENYKKFYDHSYRVAPVNDVNLRYLTPVLGLMYIMLVS
jgi:hypothetical protein